jgi:ATP-binding cassette, subfamily C, bacterial CydC
VNADPGRRPVARLLLMARPAWPRLALAALAGLGAAGAGVALMATSAWLISRAAQHPPVLYLMVAIVAVRTFGLSRGFFRYAERLAGHDAALRVLSRLRTRIYARLTRIIPAGAADLHGGDLVARFVADVDATLDILVRAVLPYITSVLVAIASVAVVAAILPAAGAVLAGGIVVAIVGVPILHSAIARRAEHRTAPLRGELADRTVALLAQLPELVAHQAAVAHVDALATTDIALRRATTRSAIALGTTAALTSAAGGACAIWALVLGASAVHTHRLDPVLLAVLVLTPLAVFDALSGLPSATAALRTGRAALQRVFAVLDRDDPVPDPATLTAAPAAPYRMALNGVTARWSPDSPPALTDVSIELPAGSCTVIVGPSGSGKTTIAALLARFLDPDAGSVTLNDIDLRHLSGEQVRDIVGLVDDNAYLFDTTIAANLRIGAPDATDAQLHAALAGAHLDPWVRALPGGLGTRVGEHGARLSGGQRRRLALARALLSDRPVLVLDEPTEHLDEPTAAALINDLLGAAGGRTVVLITHRDLAGIQADQVIRLDRGRIAEQILVGHAVN